MPRDNHIPVYMSEQLKAQVTERAEERDQSISGYFKTLARRDLQRAQLDIEAVGEIRDEAWRVLAKIDDPEEQEVVRAVLKELRANPERMAGHDD